MDVRHPNSSIALFANLSIIDNVRSEQHTGTTQARGNTVTKKVKKKFEKPLDKLQTLCYNKGTKEVKEKT